MIAKVALLCLVAVAVSAKVEMEYHPQAVLHYLELKDQHLARKVRGMLKLDADFPKPSPTSLPPGISKGLLVSILVKSCAALQYSKPSKPQCKSQTFRSTEIFASLIEVKDFFHRHIEGCMSTT